ncbi:MAG: tetratricopeptide repeat protein [Tannerellaceae bacterium]|jgi:tetratricopeptide (TPR) repeat protein|nr:tetratricopeptide repeat protein [Tannerellaceae bacterium]
MTQQEINKAYHRITGSLDNRELRDAFGEIQSLIALSREYAFQDKLDELQETYRYMLRYRIEGARDPMQEKIYGDLLVAAYELADRIKQKVCDAESSLAYYNNRRSRHLFPQVSLPELHARLLMHSDTDNQKQYDLSLASLFHLIWTSDPCTAEESAAIKEILCDRALPFTAGCQVVSALILGLLSSFDREKLLLLFDAASLPEEAEEVRVRAMIGILLTLYVYHKRAPLYRQVETRLAILSESPGFTAMVQTIILRFILSRETEKITRKLQDEIIPEMIRLNPKITRKINLGDLALENPGEEMNPEWQDILSDSSLGKKIEEFSELQQEGADVMHSTFIHLKSFPFFRDIGNWFLPFIPGHSLIGGAAQLNSGEREILETMLAATFMCNSDKYSLFFSMMQLPKETREVMISQFNGQASEAIRQNKEELAVKKGKVEVITGQYIQDLYRFFKLHPNHPDFQDIFTLPLDFHNLPILSPYIAHEESLATIAEYYLRKNYFTDALTIYDALTRKSSDNDILFQKTGYCKQMTGDAEGALEAYLRADLLNTGSKWLIRRIAACYRTLKQPAKALEYYRRYEELSPGNLPVLINIGHCYMELKEYGEALKYYFKADYLDGKSHKAWRPIAWCSFLTGKYDQARNYYHKIINDQPIMQDLLNAGHTEWALQNIKAAVTYYKLAIKMENEDFQQFKKHFTLDIPDLVIAGIEPTEVPLMLDQLRYALDSEQ